MKQLLLALAVSLGLVACAATPKPVAPPPTVSEIDCNHLYTHMLVMAVVNDVDPQFTLSIREFQGAMWSVDQQWKSEGKTTRFYQVCPQMNLQQMRCAMETVNVADITTCIRMYK
jgi:hypothetical protein